jgi:hypothetical protein
LQNRDYAAARGQQIQPGTNQLLESAGTTLRFVRVTDYHFHLAGESHTNLYIFYALLFVIVQIYS